jgi:hypothetical protein
VVLWSAQSQNKNNSKRRILHTNRRNYATALYDCVIVLRSLRKRLSRTIVVPAEILYFDLRVSERFSILLILPTSLSSDA